MNDICATCSIGIDRSVPAIVKAPSAKADVGGVGLHEMRGKALAALDHLVGRGAQGAAADHHAARGIGAAADRDLVGVGLRQMDLVLGTPSQSADHLRIARLVPLPVRQGAGEDRQFA